MSIPPPDNPTAPWQLNVDAAYVGTGPYDLRLTPAASGQRGSAIYSTAQVVLDGLYLGFETEASGGSGADGICLLLLDPAESPTSCGSGGGGCGGDGLAGTIVKLHEYTEDVTWIYNGSIQETVGDSSLGGVHDWSFAFAKTSSTVYDVTVKKGGVAYATWTGVNAPDSVWLGFSAGTGGFTNNYFVRNFTDAPPPPPPFRHSPIRGVGTASNALRAASW